MKCVCDDGRYAVVCADRFLQFIFIDFPAWIHSPLLILIGLLRLCTVVRLLIVFWLNIPRQCPLRRFRAHLLIRMNVGPCTIIILYTGTGWVNSFGGWAGAKRGAGQCPGIGDKRKHAATSSNIFLILTSLQLIKTAHVLVSIVYSTASDLRYSISIWLPHCPMAMLIVAEIL